MSQLALQQQLAWQLLSATPRLSQQAAVREGTQAVAAAAVSGPSGSGGSRGGAVAVAAAMTQRGRNVVAGGSQAASSSRMAAAAVTSSWGKPIAVSSSSSPHTDGSAAGAPWAEKYAPRSLEDLDPAVQSKKVLEVQYWLEDQLPGRFRRGGNCRMMIVTGE